MKKFLFILAVSFAFISTSCTTDESGQSLSTSKAEIYALSENGNEIEGTFYIKKQTDTENGYVALTGKKKVTVENGQEYMFKPENITFIKFQLFLESNRVKHTLTSTEGKNMFDTYNDKEIFLDPIQIPTLE